MHYANPGYLSVVVFLAIALSVFYLWAMARRKKLMNKFAEKSLVGSISPAAAPGRKIARIVMLIAAGSLMVFSLARPQWGFEWKEAKFKGIDILIAVDVSKSMIANDVKPNRLERTKFGIKDLVRNASCPPLPALETMTIEFGNLYGYADIDEWISIVEMIHDTVWLR